MNALYEMVSESRDEGTYDATFRSGPSTAGPWHPQHQHGGPPSALLARAAEALPGVPSLLARATIEILGPVPVADLRVRARVVRPGARISFVRADLLTGDASEARVVARLSAWRIRQAEIEVPPTRAEPPPAHAGDLVPLPFDWGGGFLDAVEWRWVEGSFGQPGDAVVWTRLLVPLVDGEEPSGAQRAIVVADAGSGVSAVSNPARLLFINPELTVHLHRAPVGDRVWMRAHQVLDPSGVGLAQTVLGDASGAVGAGAQSLLLDAR